MILIRRAPAARQRTRWAGVLVLLCSAIGLAGCVEKAPAEGSAHPAGISALNYTPYYIPGFSITAANGQSGGGPNVAPADGSGKPAGGGKETCCVMVPQKWHEDMRVTVRWSAEKVADGKTPGTWYRAVAKVPPYGAETYGFWVQFFEGDRIKVDVADGTPYVKPQPDDPYIVQGELDAPLNQETPR